MSFGLSGTARVFAGTAEVYRSRSRLARGARLALSASVAVSALALVVFHAALFWSQITDGRLLEPAVAVRWGLSVLLLGAFVALRRAGVPVLWGRRALVVWVLVGLLHWTAAPATELADITRPGSEASRVLIDLPTGAAATLLCAATLFLLWLVGARPAARVVRSARVRWFAAADAHTSILSLHLASRAPPAAFP